jgi:hypothetical protein
MTNGWWYNEQWPDGKVHVWPTPDHSDNWLEIWEAKTIDDMDSAGDNFALPSRWYLAVAMNLGLLLTTKYGVSDATYQKIARAADKSLFMAETSESERFLQFTPDDRGR